MALNRLDDVKVGEGVGCLLKLIEKNDSKSKILLSSSEPVYLQVDFVKIPRMRKTIARIPLQNSLLTETSDVCLIVADVKRGRNVPHNMTINHYTKLLKKRGVTDVQKLNILPSRQIRVEYTQYEARRKLCHMYDIFLIDNKISSFLFPKLGKEFSKSRKWPIPIRMKRKNLKDEILSKLKKTSLALDGTGTTKTVQIGHSGMTASEITENIVSAGAYMLKYFPGGWNNIRSLHIKGKRTASVPIYMSLISPNEVPIPKIKGKRKRSVLAVDEVSSIGRKVTVRRSGDVVVHDFSSDEDSEDGFETDEDDDSEEVENPVKNKTQLVDFQSKKRKQPDDENDAEEENDEGNSDEDEVGVEEDDAETKYLFRIQKEEEEQSKQKTSENEKGTNMTASKEKGSNNKKSKKNQTNDSRPADNHQVKKKNKIVPILNRTAKIDQSKKKKLRAR